MVALDVVVERMERVDVDVIRVDKYQRPTSVGKDDQP